MKRGFTVGSLFLLAGVIFTPGTGTGESSRCVVLEKQGNRALVSCNGGQTRYIDLGGKTDIYNVGDSVDAADIETKDFKEQPARKK